MFGVSSHLHIVIMRVIDIEYTWILRHGKNRSSIQVANFENIFWSVRSSNRGEWDEEKRVDGSYRYSSQLIREHENLV